MTPDSGAETPKDEPAVEGRNRPSRTAVNDTCSATVPVDEVYLDHPVGVPNGSL